MQCTVVCEHFSLTVARQRGILTRFPVHGECHRRANDQMEKSLKAGTLTVRAFAPECQRLRDENNCEDILKRGGDSLLRIISYALKRTLHFRM